MTDTEAPPTHLLATEFTAAAGVSYRQPDYWTRRGVIRTATPEGCRPHRRQGSGYHRWYLAEDVPTVRLMGQIQSLNLGDVETVRALAEQLLDIGGVRLGPLHIYLSNTDEP